MKNFPVRSEKTEQVSSGERIVLAGYFRKRRSFFALFLIACAMLVAAFAATLAWADGGEGWLDGGADIGVRETETKSAAEVPSETDGTHSEEVSSLSGEGEDTPPTANVTHIRTLELSRGESVTRINNESIHSPDVRALLSRDVSSPYTEEPLVLILHTHTSEGYLRQVSDGIAGELGAVTYTREEERSVVAAGRALSEVLREKGIATVHCTTVHDADGLRDAYAASAESVRFFLSLYPSVRYVIDLHRDAILDGDGAYVRAVSETEAGACAQVLPVVGTDNAGATPFEWEGNLALALQLRALLNGGEGSVCRPVLLRDSTYNQEISPYSLLLEIGTGANAVGEAELAARSVGAALARLILGE